VVVFSAQSSQTNFAPSVFDVGYLKRRVRLHMTSDVSKREKGFGDREVMTGT
jgi:hypothetical protein